MIWIILTHCSGLLDFLTNYRRLTTIPIPVFSNFNVNTWLNNIKILFYEKYLENHIKLEININKHLTLITGDEKLLAQVIINLIYNAVDGLSEKYDYKFIRITRDKVNQNQVQVVVANNGKIIPADIREKIFIPFFTTKKDGSGIGLSLSKQIIQLHNGYIYVESDVSETRFVIVI